MKKYILAAVTLAAFTGMSFAQNAPAAAPAAAPAKVEKPVARKHEMKKAEITMGVITAVDAAAKTITVKDNKGAEKQFTLESVGPLAQGAKVKVSVKDGRTAVKEMKEHKGKHEGKKHEKKAEAPKAEAAPAAATK
jgi:hypothetical protein